MHRKLLVPLFLLIASALLICVWFSSRVVCPAFVLVTDTVNKSRQCITHNSGPANAGLFSKYWDVKGKIDGWAHPVASLSIYHLTYFQHANCVYGAVAEVGVHHGKYFLALASSALPEEPKIAIDVFESQQLNIDNSGNGSKELFLKHSTEVGVRNIRIVQRDSQQVSPNDLRPYGPIRMFSVDGAHYHKAALHDLVLAARSLSCAGILILDDFLNPEWIGVTEAAFSFFTQLHDFAPFMVLCNKLFVAKTQYHAAYLSFVAGLPFVKCTLNDRRYHASRYTLAGFQVCIHTGPCTVPNPLIL